MLVSLLDDDNPPQSLPPPPLNRILTSPVANAQPLSVSAITTQVANNNHSATSITPTLTYLKPSGSSDVLSHLLTSTGINNSVGSSTNSCTQSLTSSVRSVANVDPIVPKKGRKRRIDANMSTFISTLPTRAAIIDAMKQPTATITTKPPLSKPVVPAKESVYDFEDCPSSTNIAPPPPPSSRPPSNPLPPSMPPPPSKSFALNDVTALERTAERKSGLKFVIKTNRGGSSGSATASTPTAITTAPTESAPVVTKPRTKVVEGKPFALFKQMQQQPSTSPLIPKKERKRRVSSKNKEAQPSLVLSISSPKVFASSPMIGLTPSSKKHSLVKNKPGRKKTLSSSSSESKRHRPISSDDPPVESVIAVSSSTTTGSSSGGNGTSRLIKGYKIPKVRKTTSPVSRSPLVIAPQPTNQEEMGVVSNETVGPPSSLGPPQITQSQPSTVMSGQSTITSKPQHRTLHSIVENLKRAVVESGGAPQLQQAAPSTVTAGPVEVINTMEDNVSFESNDNLFEKLSRCVFSPL